eukprot:7785284-Pyramimonas_sp.AAC.2
MRLFFSAVKQPAEESLPALRMPQASRDTGRTMIARRPSLCLPLCPPQSPRRGRGPTTSDTRGWEVHRRPPGRGPGGGKT